MANKVMYSTKLSEDQLLNLRKLSAETKIPQTRLLEDALSLLFVKYDAIARKLSGARDDG